MSIKNSILGLVGGSLYIAYFLLGIFQLAGIYAFFTNYWGWHWIISGIIGFFVAQIPLVGTILGILGAKYGWGFEWWQAILMYCWGFVLILVMGLSTRR